MSVADLQAASATTFNEAFMSRKVGTNNTVGIHDYENTDLASGPSVFNIQQNINALANALGIPANQIISFVPAWTNNGIGTATDSTRLKIDNIVTFALALQAAIANFSSWQKITIPFGDFSFAGLSNTINPFDLPALDVIEGIFIRHTQSFLGGAISDYTVDVGVTGEEDKFITGFNVFGAPGDQEYAGVHLQFLGGLSANTPILVRAQSVGANLDQATQGSLDIYYKTSSLE